MSKVERSIGSDEIEYWGNVLLTSLSALFISAAFRKIDSADENESKTCAESTYMLISHIQIGFRLDFP